jgi:CDP-diacylglycerol--serine O-phosphatidyltransferase
MTKHIPNTITCLNLLSGCLAVIFAFSGHYAAVVVCIAASALFDFCDGLAARLLHAYSPMGKELDSLADLVSFGLAPAVMSYNILLECLPTAYTWVAYVTMLIPVFAALRLAKFNIDDTQATTFKGLPVPANALWWIGACELLVNNNNTATQVCFVASIFVFSLLMVCNVPMFSLKFKGLGWRGNEVRYVMIVVSVVLLVLQGVSGFAPIIGLYVLKSVVGFGSKEA